MYSQESAIILKVKFYCKQLWVLCVTLLSEIVHIDYYIFVDIKVALYINDNLY